MKRFITILLAAGIGMIVCACEKTDFEKKAQSDADARREINTRPKSQ